MANIGKAISCLKVSIHAPGRGIQRRMPGKKLPNRIGKARPTPIAMNNSKACSAGSWMAYPSDAPMKGAVQGDATSTASTPDSRASLTGWRAVACATRPGSSCPT